MMSNLLAIPNELLDEITSTLDPLATFNLLLTCRSLSSRVLPAMLLHAAAPKDGMPALHWAALQGHLPLVQYLLTVFPADLSDESGDTALHIAAQSSHALITEHLLQHGADVNRPTHDNVTPLAYASRGVSTSPSAAEATVQVLLAHGAAVHGTAAAEPLLHAIGGCSTRMVQLLLDAGASPDTTDASGQPAIILAGLVPGGDAVLELLLSHGADINATTVHGATALMLAAQAGLLDAVKALVRRGADLNLVDAHGHAASAYAAMGERAHIAAFLVSCEDFDIHAEGLVQRLVFYGCDAALTVILQRGATPHGAPAGCDAAVRALLRGGADYAGLTPLMVAIDMENLRMVEILLECWTLDVGAEEAFLTLLLACGRGAGEVIGLLVGRGVDVNMVGARGVTVLAEAESAGWSGVVAMMASYGAR